ncbi:hypothetical protein KAR48_05670 [bacterium]|nr:hypothetical protein [bacterium]
MYSRLIKALVVHIVISLVCISSTVMAQQGRGIIVPPAYFLSRYISLHKDIGLSAKHWHFDLPFAVSSELQYFPHQNWLKSFQKGGFSYKIHSQWFYDSAIEKFGHTTALWLWSKLISHVTLFTSAIVTNHPDGEYLLGTHHIRLGHTGMINMAYVSGRWEHFELLWGRAPLQWGPGRLRQLGVQGNMPAQDLIKLTFKQDRRFRLSYFLSQLDRQEVAADDGNQVQYNRWLAGHRLEIPLFDGRLILGAGDYVLYTGRNRGIEFNYFNPLSPFHTQTFENKVEGRDTAVDSTVQADNQNVAIYADFNWAVKKNLHLYGELFVDEFQIDGADRKKMDDAVGLLFGVAGGKQWERVTWHYTFEAYRLSTWLYNHGGMATNWTYNDHQIGFAEGADLQGFTARSEWWLGMDKMIALQYTHFDQGDVTTDTPWDPHKTKGNGFPSGIIEKNRCIELSYFYYPLHWLQVEGMYAYHIIDNKNHITDINERRNVFKLSLQFIL